MPCNCTCNKPKITFRLEKWELAVVFQVLEMDERFRNMGDRPGVISTPFLEVGSGQYPDLRGGAVMIRGENDRGDFSVCAREFSSNTERDAYYHKVLASLKDWAENWPGWKTASAPGCACASATNEENVFSF